jgi:hypothetical protein
MATKTTAAQPLTIDFALREGAPKRHMRVRIPNPEQLAVWQSIGETFSRLGAEWDQQNAALADLPADHPDAVAVRSKQNRQATRGLGRSIKLIKTVLLDEADHEWVDDMIMEGATLEELMPIVSQAVAAMRARAADKGAQRTPGTAKGKAKLAE